MADQVTIIVNEVRGHIAREKARLAVEITANLIEATPVDTGWARANWIPSVGKPVDMAAGERPKGTWPQGLQSVDTGPQELGIAAVLASASGPPDVPLHVVNNVSYIGPLDRGHSAQQGAGWVLRCIEQGILTVGSIASASSAWSPKVTS